MFPNLPISWLLSWRCRTQNCCKDWLGLIVRIASWVQTSATPTPSCASQYLTNVSAEHFARIPVPCKCAGVPITLPDPQSGSYRTCPAAACVRRGGQIGRLRGRIGRRPCNPGSVAHRFFWCDQEPHDRLPPCRGGNMESRRSAAAAVQPLHAL